MNIEKITIQLKHSKKLSRRFRKESDFASTLFPELKSFIEIEKGIMESKYLKEDESIFSLVSLNDTEKDIELYTNIERNSAMLNIQRRYKANETITSLRRLKKSKWNNKILVLKMLNLKRNPNPITEIRFLDYIFYLDSDMFFDTNHKTTKEFKIMADIYDYKKVTSVIFDQNKQCFIIKMQERDTEEERNFSNGTKFKYYIDWLQSMGNSKATNLIEILTKLKQSNEDSIKKIPQYASQYSEVVGIFDNKKSEISLQKKSKINPIFFIKMIDEKTKKYILEQPYLSRTFKMDLFNKTENSVLIEEEYSMDFVKKMGYQESDMDELFLGFLRLNIQKFMYVKSAYNNILDICQRIMKKLNTKDDPTKTVYSVFSEKFISRDKYGDDAYEREIHVYEERWYENKSLYIKSYLVPYEINYFKLY